MLNQLAGGSFYAKRQRVLRNGDAEFAGVESARAGERPHARDGSIGLGVDQRAIGSQGCGCAILNALDGDANGARAHGEYGNLNLLRMLGRRRLQQGRRRRGERQSAGEDHALQCIAACQRVVHRYRFPLTRQRSDPIGTASDGSLQQVQHDETLRSVQVVVMLRRYTE